MKRNNMGRCECGCDAATVRMMGPIPLVAWCKKCGRAYDPLNRCVRLPEYDGKMAELGG
jgi:hypothetical protein